jgi:tetratricopeptide (TPR) repeat protein
MFKKIVLVFFVFLFPVFVKYQIEILNYIGKKVFLNYHNNKLSQNVFELASSLHGQPKAKAETYFHLGRVLFVEGELAKSILNYNKAIELNPTIKEYYYGRGLSYGFFSESFFDQAESDFKKYINMDNAEYKTIGSHAYGAWAGYNDLAWIYFLKGDFHKSEQIARQGLEVAQSSWLYNMLGISLINQKECKQGLIYLNMAGQSLTNISTKEFGEAYSGDSPNYWEKSQQEMLNVIKENIKVCTQDKDLSTTTISN